MDNIGGWEEETWVGSKFARSIDIVIFTKAAICHGQYNMHYLLQNFISMIDCVSCVDDAPDDNVWVSEFTISCRLTVLRYDLANPCIIQCGGLCFSAPTNLNHGFSEHLCDL